MPPFIDFEKNRELAIRNLKLMGHSAYWDNITNLLRLRDTNEPVEIAVNREGKSYYKTTAQSGKQYSLRTNGTRIPVVTKTDEEWLQVDLKRAAEAKAKAELAEYDKLPWSTKLGRAVNAGVYGSYPIATLALKSSGVAYLDSNGKYKLPSSEEQKQATEDIFTLLGLSGLAAGLYTNPLSTIGNVATWMGINEGTRAVTGKTPGGWLRTGIETIPGASSWVNNLSPSGLVWYEFATEGAGNPFSYKTVRAPLTRMATNFGKDVKAGAEFVNRLRKPIGLIRRGENLHNVVGNFLADYPEEPFRRVVDRIFANPILRPMVKRASESIMRLDSSSDPVISLLWFLDEIKRNKLPYLKYILFGKGKKPPINEYNGIFNGDYFLESTDNDIIDAVVYGKTISPKIAESSEPITGFEELISKYPNKKYSYYVIPGYKETEPNGRIFTAKLNNDIKLPEHPYASYNSAGHIMKFDLDGNVRELDMYKFFNRENEYVDKWFDLQNETDPRKIRLYSNMMYVADKATPHVPILYTPWHSNPKFINRHLDWTDLTKMDFLNSLTKEELDRVLKWFDAPYGWKSKYE